MTDHEGDRWCYWTLGIQGIWKNGLLPEVTGHFPDLHESRKSNSFLEGLVIITYGMKY